MAKISSYCLFYRRKTEDKQYKKAHRKSADCKSLKKGAATFFETL